MEEAQEQLDNSNVPKQLRKFSFKKGVSGNPGGRPVGSKSMKTYAKEYLEQMDEEDRIEFLNALDPKTVWEMSEGKPKQDIDAEVKGTINVVVPGPVAKAFNIHATDPETGGSNTEQS